jgi:hypothetical protein
MSQLKSESFARNKRKNLTQSSIRTQSEAWKLVSLGVDGEKQVREG